MEFTWPIAFTIIGLTIAFLSFLYRMFKKDITIEDVKRYKELNEKFETVKDNTQDNKKDIEAIKERLISIEDKFKYLLDKFIDLIKSSK